jgi:hypothetical protein
VNDRVVRMAQETAGRLLRAAGWRAGLVTAVLATWPKDPEKRTPEEWDALRAAVPDGQGRLVASGILRARTRQIAGYLRRHNRLPTGVFELEASPGSPRMLPLAAVDRQQATLARCPDDPDSFAVLRVQLPTRPDPGSYRDWTWVAIRFRLPPTVPSDAALHLPTLRVNNGKARADVAFTHAVPAVARTGHTVALGVDWGVSCLLTAGVVHLTQDVDDDSRRDGRRCVTGNRTLMFRADGILAKADRLRRAGEAVSAKVNQQRLLLDGRQAAGLPTDPALQARHDLLVVEQARIAARRRHLNIALANAAANWLTSHAIAAGAAVIYVEDLRDLEARGKGRALNTRLSQTVRGQLLTATRHAAARHGIAVVTVPARETSKRCPRCLAVVKHSKAPDRPDAPGWKWATCPGCGWTGDRDAGAWQRIAARGLLHQHETVADPTIWQLRVRGVDSGLDAASGVYLQAQVVDTPTPNTINGGDTGDDRSVSGPKPHPGRRRAQRRTRVARRRRRPSASSSRGAPRKRRTAPSPPRSRHPRPRRAPHPCPRTSRGRGGQRPEGRAPQDQSPAKGFRSQAAAATRTGTGGPCTTIGTAPRHQGPGERRHRPRGARLGAGFHLGAHATRPGTGLRPGGRRC